MSRVMTRQAILDDPEAVDPSHRRQGLGALWLDAAVPYGLALGAVGWSLTINSPNLTAQIAAALPNGLNY